MEDFQFEEKSLLLTSSQNKKPPKTKVTGGQLQIK
jgi:hypothetical protein